MPVKAFISLLVVATAFLQPATNQTAYDQYYETKWADNQAEVLHLVNKYATDPKTTTRIATCESQLGLYRENWEGSSAQGLLMFMPKTFNAYCEGEITNDIDQILCFNELYPRHPSWWECSKQL